MIETLVNALAKEHVTLNDTQISQFEKYYQLLIEWNEKISNAIRKGKRKNGCYERQEWC